VKLTTNKNTSIIQQDQTEVEFHR